MKLFYVYPESLPTKRARGVQVAHTCRALADHVQKIYLVLADNPQDIFSYYGLTPCPNLEIIRCKRKIGPFTSSAVFYRKVKQEISNKKPEVVITRHLQAIIQLSVLNIPVIFEAHQFFREKPGASAKTISLEKKAWHNSSAVAFLSENLQNHIIKEMNCNFPYTVIPSGTSFVPAKTQEKLPAQNILYAGSTRYPWKGIAILLQAMLLLDNVRLHLIGALEGEWSLEHPIVQKLWKRKQLVLHGYLPQQKLTELMPSYQIAILPNTAGDANSLYYTSPLKLLEYMAFGLAIVASDLPSIRELVSEREALLVPPGNPQVLADAIKTLIEQPQLRQKLSSKACEKAQDYTWDKRAQKFISLINKVRKKNVK